MGIEKIEAYICTCDNCGETYDNGDYIPMGADESHLKDMMGSDWIETDGKYYCLECYQIDDNDNIVLDETRNHTIKLNLNYGMLLKKSACHNGQKYSA